MKSLAKKIVPARLWLYACGLYWGLVRGVRQWISEAQIVGIAAAARFHLEATRGSSQEVKRLRLKGYRHPIYYRTNSSDLDVIKQVFLERQYDCVGYEPDVKFIIDCGANIGCATLYFLHRYPEARIVAVEPDDRNFEMCSRNLAPFLDRVSLVNSGIWPTPVPLKTERGSFGDGREWAIQVRPAMAGEAPDLTGATIDDLIEISGFAKVDILKIDIEGSELELFSEGTDRWLPMIRSIAIELHGPECEQSFEDSLDCYKYSRSEHGELIVCKNIESAITPRA